MLTSVLRYSLKVIHMLYYGRCRLLVYVDPAWFKYCKGNDVVEMIGIHRRDILKISSRIRLRLCHHRYQ